MLRELVLRKNESIKHASGVSEQAFEVKFEKKQLSLLESF